MAKKFYAVKRGRQRGIFTDWHECKAQVDGYERPVYKGFMTLAEAEAWLGNRPQPQAPGADKAAQNAGAVLYTDGSCLSNPNGPGGYAAIVVTPESEREIVGGAASTTNNRMELTAVIAGLRGLPPRCSAAVFTDSRYVCEAFNQHWVDGWLKRNWRTSAGEPVKNIDLWRELLAELALRDAAFHWVRGHNADPRNERCDALARNEAAKHR